MVFFSEFGTGSTFAGYKNAAEYWLNPYTVDTKEVELAQPLAALSEVTADGFISKLDAIYQTVSSKRPLGSNAYKNLGALFFSCRI